jgi:hypothetical protein
VFKALFRRLVQKLEQRRESVPEDALSAISPYLAIFVYPPPGENRVSPLLAFGGRSTVNI